MIGLITWLALLAYTLVGPIVKRGGNHAKHNALMVWLPYDETTEKQGQHPEGRRTQEIGENRLQGLFGLAVALAPALLIEAPYGAVVTVLAYILAKSALYFVPVIDTAGHGAEIMVAEADGHVNYYIGEIDRMLDDPRRAGKSFEDVFAEIERVEWLSRIMVKLAW